MEKLEDNIDVFLLRRIAYNIPEKAKLKRVKLKGEILDSPVLASKKYHLNEYLDSKDYNQIILEFESILRKSFGSHCDISSFYRNIQELTINEEQSTLLTTIKRLLGRNNEGAYCPEENKIKVMSDNNGIDVFFHELLHLASTKVTPESIVFTGFCQGQNFGKKMTGLYINEGYTEYLNCKYFLQRDSIYYEGVKQVARGIEDIIGEKKMEELYFNSDLKGLIQELSKYTTEREVLNLIARMDSLGQRPTMSKMNRVLSETRQTIAEIKINKARTQYNQGQISEVEKEKQILFAKLYSLEGFVFEQDAHIEREETGIRITDRNNNVYIDNKANIKVGRQVYHYQVQK